MATEEGRALARARLRELCGLHGLDATQAEGLWRLLELLEEDEQAPTTVREPARAVDVHVADSLAALEVEAVRGARRIADLGSGAGFPGLPLALALRGAQVRLVESQLRRCMFLELAVARAGAANATVVRARAEEWHEGMGENDVVLARALAPEPVVLEYAAPLLAPGGRLVDWRGARDSGREREAALAASELGLRREEVRAVAPFAEVQARSLHLYLKVAPTPSRYPRRPGVARRRPRGQGPDP
jgi:16S rRNA (guanine527-N7)-methyltransferase